MNELIQRYLDGELSEEDARALREAIARDPEVDAELREWERMLGAAAGAETGAPSAGFTDRVMRDVAGRGLRSRLRLPHLGAPRLFDLSWRTGLAWAATLVVTFGLGAMAGRIAFRTPAGPAETRGAGTQGVPEQPATSVVGQSVTAAGQPDQGGMRVVRLVYVPRDSSVRTVRVTGTFNDWDAQGVPLQRKGDVWTAVLFLPRGTYEYMFVEDGNRWVTDPLALQTRDDGFGNRNAVLDLTL
jgi:hypothetical protein